MTAVARRASCSKETLYKWFGDRDGLLTATVQWQAAKVRVPQVDRKRLDAGVARASIEQFARDLLATHRRRRSRSRSTASPITHATGTTGSAPSCSRTGRSPWASG